MLRIGGVAAAGGAPGVASGASSAGLAPVRVAATAPYLASVREALDGSGAPGAASGGVRRAEPGGSVSSDGVAVRVSGAPLLPAGPAASEGADADGTGALTPELAGIDAVAALVHPDGEWRECLGRSAVEAHSADSDPVETWLEHGAEAREDGVEAREDGASSGELPGGGAAAPAASATPLVLGTRAYQYAAGRGGLGFYGVAPDDVVPARELEASHEPVARLAYVHVAPDARDEEAVRAALDAIDAATASVPGRSIPE